MAVSKMDNDVCFPVQTAITRAIAKTDFLGTFKWRVVDILPDAQYDLEQDFQLQCGTEFTCELKINNSKIEFSMSDEDCAILNEDSAIWQGKVLFINCHGRILYKSDSLYIIDENIVDLNKLPNNELIIKCCLKRKGSEVKNPHCCFRKTAEPPIEYLTKLSEDLKGLSQTELEEEIDISFSMGGQEQGTISIGKAILCSRSSYFKAMFQNDMKEKKHNVVILKEVDLHIFVDLVMGFLYSGVVVGDCRFESLCDLYCAADKLLFPELRNTCVDLLLERITVHNVYRVLLISDQRNDQVLMDGVMNYFSLYFEELIKTYHWRNLMMEMPKLAFRVINFCRQS